MASVVMAAYNEEKYIAEAIGSVQQQTLDDWELVIIDDHSSDGTFEIANKMAASDSRIRVMKNPGKGKVKAFNAAVAQASGRYVHLFAGDDVLETDCLKACCDKLRETGAVAVYHELQRVDENLVVLEHPLSGGALSGHSLDEAVTHHTFSVASGLWMFDRKASPVAWPIPDNVPYEDLWLGACFRIAGEIEYLPDRLYFYRQHAAQTYGMSEDASLERYKFRMERLSRALDAIINHPELRGKFSAESIKVCEGRVEFGALLSEKPSLIKLIRSRIPTKRKLSIFVAWYIPGVWEKLRNRALGVKP